MQNHVMLDALSCAKKMSDSVYSRVDLSTLSNYTSAISTHIDLQWSLDFDKSEIKAVANHNVTVLVSGTTTVDFDSSNLHFDSVLINDSVVAELSKPENHPALGQKIVISIPLEFQAKGSAFKVTFKYTIGPTASALQWLSPSATKGGKHPYLFSQSCAIHARSMFPCLDTPALKTTYSASVTAPSWCTVLMSALSSGSVTNADGTVTYNWHQPVPVAAYLIAIAAGNLDSRDISDRVRIWAEPEVVDEAHYEFGETEDFLQAAEAITNCPYVWTRYDVLCLPPSFPYGGMENPCLTFATPTLLAGDRSLASVIAHEIAHSWTGNLVTNHTWAHFWLNEGWTVWLERKIVSRVANNPEVGKLSAQLNWKAMSDDISRMGGTEGKFTGLIWPLGEGEDPDDAFSTVPYEKGFNLLNYLENLVGERLFMEFVKQYLQKFKFITVTSGEFRDCFIDVVSNPSTVGFNDSLPDVVKSLPWDQLFTSRGMPTHTAPDFSNSLSRSAELLASKWIEKAAQMRDIDVLSMDDVSEQDIEGWVTSQKTLLLDLLIVHANSHQTLDAEEVFPTAFIAALEDSYHFTASKNAEIRLRWYNLCIHSESEWILSHVVDFITSQGRMKFVRPLYRSLRDSEMGAMLAVETYQYNMDKYHPIARKMLAADLFGQR